MDHAKFAETLAVSLQLAWEVLRHREILAQASEED
jgi:hypothetical protein